MLGDTPAPDGYRSWSRERARRIPLQHITGVAHFRYLELAVGPGVFVPRPETESVVQLVVDSPGRLQGTAHPKVVDLGTGSGAIAGSIAHEVPGAEVHAVEFSEFAHAWAPQNLCPSASTSSAVTCAMPCRNTTGRSTSWSPIPRTSPPKPSPTNPKSRCTIRPRHCTAGERTAWSFRRRPAASAARLLVPGGLLRDGARRSPGRLDRRHAGAGRAVDRKSQRTAISTAGTGPRARPRRPGILR